MPSVFRAQSPWTIGSAAFPAMLAWACGVAIQLQQPQLWLGAWYWAALAVASVLLLSSFRAVPFCSPGLPWRNLWIALGVALLSFSFTGLRASRYVQNALEPAFEGRDIRVTGVVAGLPQPNESGVRFTLLVESAQLQEKTVQLPRRVHVSWYRGLYPNGETPFDLQRYAVSPVAGERWQMTLRLKAPHGAHNPHGFDYELWLWEQDVQATGYVRAGLRDTPPKNLGQTWRHPIDLARQMLRERITAHVLDKPVAGMLTALVVGDQAAIEHADWDVFRATGVAHLVSISGLHITMFAWAACGALAWLWRRSARLCLHVPAPQAGLVGAIFVAWSYALFSGWGVPAQRTCVMLAVVVFLRSYGKRWPWPVVWMFACTVVLIADPWALLQAGFWLSFVAVGVLFATDTGQEGGRTESVRLASRSPTAHAWQRIKVQAISSALAMLREQGVITVALAALTLLLFGQISTLGLFANLLAIPWVTLVITPLSILGVVLPGLWDISASAAAALRVYLQWLAGFEWAVFSVAQPPLWLGLAGVLGGLVCVLPWSWRMRILGLPLLFPVLLWRAPVVPADEFELLAADIGQGNAVLLRTANHVLLYDAGPRYSLESDAGNRVLLPLLNALHLRLDMLVLSHRDTDHVGGAHAVLARQASSSPPIHVLSSIEDTHPLQLQQTIQRCVSGQSWRWDGVQFEVLHPQSLAYARESLSKVKPNALSCVLRISNGVRTVLLVGDIERTQEEQLVAAHTRDGADAHGLRADVLLVPHHGSNTSSIPEFLDAVQPRWALVQAGYRNRFGHPSPVVLERYAQRHIQVVDSARCGAITWRSWQAAGIECSREKNRRYWQHRVPPLREN